MIQGILSGCKLEHDGIYVSDFCPSGQDDEIRMREEVASHVPPDYLGIIGRNHSIQVMDREVDIFLENIPVGGLIVDVGGGWGWHWRRIERIRPDVSVVIVDFVRSNLYNAARVLKGLVNSKVYLVWGDATSLKFPDNSFDGWWSVQTLQHIPNFKLAVSEARRVLKDGGSFANYSLNNQWLVRLIYNLFGKHYHIKGYRAGFFYLDRASAEQFMQVEQVFSNVVTKRYTEVLFSPELGIRFPGKHASIAGWLDTHMSTTFPIFTMIARQQSFHTTKPLT